MTARFRGTVVAAAVLVDPALAGTAEARRRVLALAGGGLDLRVLPGGGWLAVLADPVELRIERAPGLPLVATGGGLAAPGLAGAPGTVRWPVAGAVRTAELAGLTRVPTAGWVDLSAVPVHRLAPLDRPEPAPVRPAEPVRPAPNLRAAARVGPPPAELAGLTGPRRPGPVREALARLVAGAAPGVLAGRHERYLRSLTASFERRDWDDALRRAIGLGGDPAGRDWLTLRLPRPRRDLSLGTGGPGAAVALGDRAQDHLHRLYERAAAALEAAGRLDEAVFVHAELLGDVPAAVALLERQGRLRMAAELAEDRGLPPELAVRLWWRAGDRDRALAAARARGAFAAGVDRLAQVDPAAAVDLRRAWVADRRAAGDPLGALAAAWPEPALRAAATPDAEAALALGGATGGTALAHLVALDPAGATGPALELLGRRDPGSLRARAALVATLAALPGPDPARDRQVCTAAVRSAYRLPRTDRLRDQVGRLSRRADPLLAADLPPVARPDPAAPVDLVAPAAAGQLPVFDAVARPDRTVLVACGDAGVRLLSADGRTRARWDVPAHQIVLADGGAAALLVRRAGALHVVSRLDLRTRQVRPGPVLRLHRLLSSYDGAVVVAVDTDGIVLLDLHAERPRVLWRELEPGDRVLAVGRTPQRLTALVLLGLPAAGGGPWCQLWSWELPGMTLRVRRTVEPDILAAAVRGDGVTVLAEGDGDPVTRTYTEQRAPVVAPAAPGTLLRADGAALAAIRPLDGGRRCTVDLAGRPDAVDAVFPAGAAAIDVREHAGVVTLRDGEGRILAAEPGGAGALASFATVL